ncbi:hypothetical protein PYJP_11260 [Pyrofollis japonicus]|nr:hypothetical protein PYJP_11260 [Pyrofollis japonicus]
MFEKSRRRLGAPSQRERGATGSLRGAQQSDVPWPVYLGFSGCLAFPEEELPVHSEN